MIHSLKGILTSYERNKINIDLNGLCFEIFASKKVIENLPQTGNEVFVYIYLDVKENSLTLYGFYDEKEKEIFKLLNTVNGISSKTAHNILSYASFEEIINLINDTSNIRMMKIPGIGEKKIDLISVSLRDKIFKIPQQEKSPYPEMSREMKLNENEKSRYDALNALINLGYQRTEAEKIIREVLKQSQGQILTTEDIIKKSLTLKL
jgi:Holliday junction DNA helicase RuvA